MPDALDFSIPNLGQPGIASPIRLSTIYGDKIANYVSDDQAIVYDINMIPNQAYTYARSDLLELAGPRQKIFFDPATTHAGIVTCGGLCPGLNNVIRSVVMCLWYRYGVRSITGIRFGYCGFLPEYKKSPMELNPDRVVDIHMEGGTVLGSSRGGGDRISEIVDAIEHMKLNILFTIGGDGTQKGALKITDEIDKRKLKIAVVGIPKTIDNDLSFIERSFGFETAVEKAVEAVNSAHTEAHDALNGVGIVQVMGRESGFIAADTVLATNHVNFVLIPEVPFELDGQNGLMACLKERINRRHHAVILIAEGAGQQMLTQLAEKDKSGNKKLSDIGLFIKAKVAEYFKQQNIDINIKYIDPSYIIRSAPANPSDAIYCSRLGANAAHAAMTGKTKMLIGLVNNNIVHIPMKLAVSKRNFVDPESSLWRDVIEATGQPIIMVNQ
jgi:6-phosphofructokinase 1